MNCAFCLCLKCPKDFVRPMSLVMDDRGSQPHPRNTALRVSTKTKAPSPPGLKKVDCPGFSQWHPGGPHLTMDQKENLMDKELSLTVVLPGGLEKKTQVEGSKAVMDLLVTLCAEYHLNPSTHTLEEVTASRKNVKLKPNVLIGALKTDKIILKPKGEDQKKKTSPQMPEATVRMVINYKKTQKTVLRVNPQAPLHELLPAICEKCEFTAETTVLLRDVTSSAPLDLSKSLNDYTIREIYAKDMQGRVSSPVCPSSPLSAGAVSPGKDKNQKEKENKGLFSKFKKSKKKSEQPTTASAPASPVLVSKPRPLSMALPCSNSSPIGSPNFADVPKKRRAPPPPILVSQSGHSDLATRQRINSAPTTQLDGIQRSPVSCGSSAESTLRRTKRKAPPPPTSPSPIVQKTGSEEEHLQVPTVLQEITEHEEAAGSVMSSVTDTQGENGSLNVSPESSLHSPSPDAESRSTVEAGGEDQCLDLSSDGKRVDSFVNGSAAQGIKTRDDSDSSEPTVANSVAVQVEDVHPEPISEGTKTGSSESNLPAPVKKDAEVQASCDAQTEPPRKPCDESASSVTVSAPCPAGADAPVQTDSKGLSVPPQQDVDKVPLSADSAALGSAEKKDMSTSTEELEPPKPDCASLHATSTSPCQDSKPSVPASPKAPPVHAADPELKPKPSNELTRDYIPKVGMTTYKIVPQKSLEKLRYFEVALTLEAPPEAPGEELGSGSPGLKEDQGQNEVLKENTELNSNLTRDDSLSRTTNATTTLSTTTMQHTVNGSIPEPPPLSPLTTVQSTDKTSPSANGASQAGSAAEVKEMKIPPATKPKPASFRLGQHKKTPGYYVTSAAEKNLGASPASGLKETPGSPDHAVLPSPPLPPPPPLPPAQCQEETAEVAGVQFSTKQDSNNVPSMGLTRQSSLPPRQPGAGMSLVKLRSFAAPRPFSPPKPSRFAQAVSSAVKRTQSLSHGSRSPPSSVSPPVSPITSPSPVTQSKGLSELKGEEVSQTAKESGL
ncbi:cordon-bleu protein-like 1b isoform X2 [Fundulus heteroclitus]|uniref:cordon-bleu protein-like 1b isoform X2 n=1 Tax=Fundulus heteroclitus TaxID=8078 RepID=UPI00165B3EB1|nr:cordon-bleu protein-like 1b isoform X2 [Fundulus heteroclitus]XP_021177986.2 cordon-bleu protein-like 1b isoform X2 [Fundulus heteroclitus]